MTHPIALDHVHVLGRPDLRVSEVVLGTIIFGSDWG